MQNLSLFNTRTVSLPQLTGANVVRRFAIDTDKQMIYLLTSDQLYSLSLENEQLTSIYQTTDATITLEDLCFLSEMNHLCFGLSNGDLLSLQFDNEELETNLNVIGTLEESINELKLSPDQQTLVAVTNSKVLLLSTTNDYEPLAETFLDTNEFGEQQFVNVGWGSKTTQFHGSVGKKAALETTTASPPTTHSKDDDGRSRIVWRDDGDLFAVSFLSATNQWRTIKIFNKQGQLQSTNETPLNGFIEPAIAWKSSGELISAAMRFNQGQKLTVSFLEKNGLKHGEFLLQSTGFVEHLAWNKDSTILAVVLREENNTHLQLWSSNNYHWYLKQSFPLASIRIESLMWDIDQSNKLHFITDNGEYHSMNWSWINPVSYSNRRSLVYLIDGNRLNVSDFTHSSIPPPMCSYEIPCSQSIVAVASDDERDQIVLVLSDRSLVICDSTDSRKSIHSITSVVESSPIETLHHCTHFRLLNGLFYFIENSNLNIYHLEKKSKQTVKMNFSCLSTTIGVESTNFLYLQDEYGKIYRLENEQFHARMHFPRPCPQFSVLPDEQFVGLTENYRLYLNNTELAHNCNSYFIHDRIILVYSTLQHQLAFRSLATGQTVTEASHRRTERGTRIVCTAYTDLKLILQMPRGNLETIYPRPLLLTYISSELIDHEPRNYRRAFELMRKNRLNLNFLYDYKPAQFFDQIPTFIANVRSDDDICLFLSEIDHEKNTRDEYMKYILKSDNSEPIDLNKWHPKANIICERFRSCLRAPENINSILTSFIKQSPANMEGALKFLNEHPTHFDNAIRYLTYFIDIDRLYDIALGTYNFDLVMMISEKTQKDPKEYLPELNQLRAISNVHWQKFQIDCRLKRYKKAIENGADYFIEQLNNGTADEHDGNYPIFLNILENHRLYKLAIKRFLSQSTIRPTMFFIGDILRLYGDYLMSKKYYVEAGLIYERGQFNDQASQAFRQGKDVQNALKFLPLVPRVISTLSTADIEQYRSLGEQCRHDGLLIDSGSIFENCLGDYEEALLSYLQGHQWSHAVRLLSTHLKDRRDLYEHEFLSSFNQFFDDLSRQIHNDFEKFQTFNKRLTTLRTNLVGHIKEILDSGRDYDLDEQSDVDEQNPIDDDRRTLATRNPGGDDTGSIRTRLSKKSGSVSSSKKSQRRAAQQQEKLVQLKEGSKHEDLALVRELWLLINKFDQLNGEIRHLTKISYQISSHENQSNYEEKGEILQMKYNEYLTIIEKQLSNIWLNNVETTDNVQMMIISKKIREKFKKDFEFISNQYRVPPPFNSKTSQWKLILFDSNETLTV